MQPAGDPRYWRKGQRRAWRGTPRGRRATHRVETTYGRGQQRRDWLAMWAAVMADPAPFSPRTQYREAP